MKTAYCGHVGTGRVGHFKRLATINGFHCTICLFVCYKRGSPVPMSRTPGDHSRSRVGPLSLHARSADQKQGPPVAFVQPAAFTLPPASRAAQGLSACSTGITNLRLESLQEPPLGLGNRWVRPTLKRVLLSVERAKPESALFRPECFHMWLGFFQKHSVSCKCVLCMAMCATKRREPF